VNEKIKLMIVDDEEGICEIMQSYFERKGYSVSSATSAAKALPIIKEIKPQIMLLDKRMPDKNGIELLKEVRVFNQELKVIMISADKLDPATAEEVRSLNLSGYMSKPLILSELDVALEKIKT